MKAMVEQDAVAVSSLAEELIEIMNRHHVFYWECYTEGLLGWASASTGDLATGLARLKRSAEIRDRMQTRMFGAYFLISEADILVQNHRSDEAMALLDRAAAEANGPTCYDAEALRVQACARLAQGAPLTEVESLFQRALTTARTQNARLFEVRAATGLARVWRDAGRIDDARALLAPLHGWFTSGHDTPDLIQARAVLDRLG
jgi:predicted ATPase